MIVGRVLGIARYPVKSMAGEDRAAAEVDWQGVEGDRQYALVKRDDATRFPWFTARDLPSLVRHRARYADPDRPRTSPVLVERPDGGEVALDDAGLLATLEAQGSRPLALMQLGRGAYDAMPVSLVTTASLALLDRAHGASVDPRRFRANFVIASDRPDAEWVGCRLRLGAGAGAAEFHLAHGVARCAVVTLGPDDAARDASVLRTVARRFNNAFCTYADVARPGAVRVGDPAVLVG